MRRYRTKSTPLRQKSFLLTAPFLEHRFATFLPTGPVISRSRLHVYEVVGIEVRCRNPQAVLHPYLGRSNSHEEISFVERSSTSDVDGGGSADRGQSL